jgi:hypothetical protein
MDALGSNIVISTRSGDVLRVIPRINEVIIIIIKYFFFPIYLIKIQYFRKLMKNGFRIKHVLLMMVLNVNV